MSRTEHDNLHDALREAADATMPRPIDVDAVLRASRARRRARRTAAAGGAGAAVALLAVGGLVFGMQQGAKPVSGEAPAAFESTEGEDAAASDGAAGAPESATGFLPGPDVLRCGEPAAAAGAATSPLVVAVTPPASVTPGGGASVTVTVTNDAGAQVEGALWSTPAVAIFDDGTAVARSIPAGDAVLPISLEPGESITVTGSFQSVGCTADAARPDSAAPAVPLPAGAYELGVVIGFVPNGGEPVQLDSPLVPLTIR